MAMVRVILAIVHIADLVDELHSLMVNLAC